MSNQFEKDRLFAEMMQNSKLTMPFADFEERTMARINGQLATKSVLTTDKKLALLFFTIGAGFGFLISYFLTIPRAIVAGLSSDTILLIFRTAYILLFLTQLDSIIKLLAPSKYGALSIRRDK